MLQSGRDGSHVAISFRIEVARRISCAVFALLCCVPGAAAQSPPPGKLLTVERLYREPSLNGALVEGLEWSPDGRRISFYQTTGEGSTAKTELWAMDASDGQKHLLVDSAKLASLLKTERASAIQATGLARVAPGNYVWSADGNQLVFKSAGRIAWLDLRTMFSKILVDDKQTIADPKFSPDGKWVSFLRESNIWLANVMSGEVKQLTREGNADLLDGALDWVYPEELSLGTAYWWSPDSQEVAFLQFDETPVTKYPIVDLEGRIDVTHYPQAGEANPIVRLGVVSVGGGQPTWVDTGKDTDVYLPRVDWSPDGKSLLIQRLTRAQNKLELLRTDPSTGQSRTIITEQDSDWVNVSDLPMRFFADGKRFLWISERTGFAHIYLYNLDGQLLEPLSRGDWAVLGAGRFGPEEGSDFVLDEKGGAVYFLSNKDNVVERHLYRLSLADKSVTRVTAEAGTHDVKISPSATAFVDTYSNAMTPPRQDLRRMDGSPITAIDENRVPELSEYHLSPVEFTTVKAGDGTELSALMIKPPDFDATKKYPVLINVYGGPHAQVVLNHWGGTNFLWHQLMAEKGYIIWELDNRGSYGRGHNFEKPISHHFGSIELVDQLAGVNYLKSLPYVDPNRIGIWGWSYGGFMTLNALFNAPLVFKVGVSVAPVTDWRLYDTIYTERYMGRPQDNPQGYKDSSPVNQTEHLHGKLMSVHGTGDDNVHFANTETLLDRLIPEGKYPELLIFPGRGHPISDPPARILLFDRITDFLLANL